MHWKLADVDDPLYYWHNFEFVRQWIQSHHQCLLSTHQRQLLLNYAGLTTNAQCLWLRLFMRKGELFRLTKLAYAEIDIHLALAELRQAGWIRPLTEAPSSALPLYTKAELCAYYEQPPTLSKARLIEIIAPHVIDLPDAVIQLCNNEAFNQLAILFFGNSYQQLSEFVVTALGHVQYERYTVRPETVFPSYEDFQQFCLIDVWQRHYAELQDTEQRLAFAKRLVDSALISANTRRNEGKLSRLINRVARDCERMQEVNLALALYQYAKRTPCRERQARLLYRIDRVRCRQLLHEMFNSPWDAPELAVASSLLVRWFNEQDKQDGPRPPAIELTLAFQPRQVEQAVMSQLTGQGWRGWHSENLIPQALFGLIFWDILFADIEGAFIHPFQRAPRDLNSPHFYHKRAARINRRLAAVTRYPQAVMTRARNNLSAKAGIANSFVAWRWEGLSEAIDWLSYLPSSVWHGIFKRIAFDVKNNRSGFPDLWLVNAQGDIRLVEVKAPGDTLRPNQKRWLSFLLEQGVDIQVVSAKPIADATSGRPA